MNRATTVSPASVYRASVTWQSDDAWTHPSRKSSLNSWGVLNVMPRAWSIQPMLWAYSLTIASKSRWLNAS